MFESSSSFSPESSDDDGPLDPDRPLAEKYDVWILGASAVNYHSHEQAVRKNKGFWMYDCAVPNNNAAFARAQYGFAAYAANLGGVWQWGYYDASEKFVMTADGRVDAKPQLARVALGPDGPVPTVAWEATREGTEDYRLVQCFCNLFAAASQVNRDKLANVHKTLADSDCGLIRKREEQKYGKQPPAPPLVEWTTDTEAKKAAEKEFLDVLELERVLFTAGLTKSHLVDSVPFALGGSGRIPSEDWRAHYAPDLGETEPATAAEVKRAVLLPHALRLQEIVRRYRKAGG